MSKDFFVKFWSHWIAATGGTVAFLASAYLYLTGKNYLGVGALAVAGIACFFIASYQTWKEEHQKLAAELERNQVPEIRGDILQGVFCLRKENHEILLANKDVFLNIRLVNHRNVETTIRSFELEIARQSKRWVAQGESRYAVNVDFRPADSVGLISMAAMGYRISDTMPLRRAIEKQGWVKFEFSGLFGDGTSLSSDLRLTITDSLGGKHEIRAPNFTINYGFVD